MTETITLADRPSWMSLAVIILSRTTLDRIVRRSADKCCPYPSEREECRQEIWIGIIEGRIDVTEIYCRKTMKKFWRDVWHRPALRRGSRHRSMFEHLGQSTLTYEDLLEGGLEYAPEQQRNTVRELLGDPPPGRSALDHARVAA